MTQETNPGTDFRGKLLKALSAVDRPGAVCVSRDLPLTMPGLEIDKIGLIRLPLDDSQARGLIKKCSQAPYGKGAQTLVDTKVRRVWELNPQRFRLTNPKWESFISTIAGEAQEALGLADAKLRAHLYKLLIYEKGSFFLPHRDGEKLDGMVATLVVCLPSVHAGGALIVSHEGRQHVVTFSGAAAGHELSYAAFYADCEHEVRPVREGYRISLIYHLAIKPARRRKEIGAPRTGAAAAAISELLHQWPDGVKKIAVALDHRYSQEGLKIDNLKGIDRTRAEVLFDAAEKSNCVAHLALITHWQSGSAEGGEFDGYGSWGQRERYGDWSASDEDEAENGGDSGLSGYQMGEIFDSSLDASHWSDRDGNDVALGTISLGSDEIISSQPLHDWEIGREEFEGYTGNAGMTLDRWYHRAAVVLWPRKSQFRILCGAGTDAAVAGFEAMAKKWRQLDQPAKEQEQKSCLEFAKAIIDTWSVPRFCYSPSPDEKSIDRAAFPATLQELDSLELVCKFLARAMPRDGQFQLDKHFPTFCKRHGWRKFEPSLTALMDASSAATAVRNAGLLELLCLEADKDSDRIELCCRLAKRAVAALIKIDRKGQKQRLGSDEARNDELSSEDWSSDDLPDDGRELNYPERAAFLTALVKSLVSIEAKKSLAELTDYVSAQSAKYDLTEVCLKTIFALEGWLTGKWRNDDPAVSSWLAHCRSELEERTKQAPSRPTDSRRAANLPCNCSDCQALRRFLEDPHEAAHRFPMSKQRRQHLHRMIDRCGSDVTHVTERAGRPFTLVCTKTTASHEKALGIYSRDCKNLERLRAIEKANNRPTKHSD